MRSNKRTTASLFSPHPTPSLSSHLTATVLDSNSSRQQQPLFLRQTFARLVPHLCHHLPIHKHRERGPGKMFSTSKHNIAGVCSMANDGILARNQHSLYTSNHPATGSQILDLPGHDCVLCRIRIGMVRSCGLAEAPVQIPGCGCNIGAWCTYTAIREQQRQSLTLRCPDPRCQHPIPLEAGTTGADAEVMAIIDDAVAVDLKRRNYYLAPLPVRNGCRDWLRGVWDRVLGHTKTITWLDGREVETYRWLDERTVNPCDGHHRYIAL